LLGAVSAPSVLRLRLNDYLNELNAAPSKNWKGFFFLFFIKKMENGPF